MVRTMMIHGVGIFFLSLGVRVSERLFHFVAFLCLSIYSFSFVSFHSIEYAILFLPICLLAESQSVSQPMMLKHLTERQKHNLIKHFEQSHESEKRGQKKRKYVELNYVHMWNRYTSTAHIHSLVRSFAHLLHTQWATVTVTAVVVVTDQNLSHCGNIS